MEILLIAAVLVLIIAAFLWVTFRQARAADAREAQRGDERAPEGGAR